MTSSKFEDLTFCNRENSHSTLRKTSVIDISSTRKPTSNDRTWFPALRTSYKNQRRVFKIHCTYKGILRVESQLVKCYSVCNSIPPGDVSSSNTREDSRCPSWRISRVGVHRDNVKRKGRKSVTKSEEKGREGNVTKDVSAEGEMANEGRGRQTI